MSQTKTFALINIIVAVSLILTIVLVYNISETNRHNIEILKRIIATPSQVDTVASGNHNSKKIGRSIAVNSPCENEWAEAGQQCPKEIHAFFACADVDWKGFVVVHGDTCDCKKIYFNSSHYEIGAMNPGDSVIINFGE